MLISRCLPAITVMNHSVRVWVPTSSEMSSMPDVTLHALRATDSYWSLWVLCTIIAQLMMQLLMRAVAPKMRQHSLQPVPKSKSFLDVDIHRENNPTNKNVKTMCAILMVSSCNYREHRYLPTFHNLLKAYF